MFMDLGGNHNVFLISGLGLNLAAASEIILLDQDWNPQVTKQAIYRAYRIGLKSPLTVYQFVARGTVEEQMMPRIAKKLYLSAKVTESMEDIYTQATPSSKERVNGVSSGDNSEMPEMNTKQLMTLIRRGAAVISRPEMDVSKMQEWDWETTIKECKDQAADLIVRKAVTKGSNVDEDESEREWLAERERIQSRFLNGETIEDHRPKSTKYSEDFAPSDSRADRKIGKERTVMMGGYMVSKDNINNDQWEAVKTFSSTNAKTSAPKREEKPDINSQGYCQVCKVEDGLPLILCKVCPRVYHNECLTDIYQTKAQKFQFACPQHICKDCKQRAGDVGGMLYRCRWCEKAQCEDCIDWKSFKPLGDTLIELHLLGFAKAPSAFYVHCQDCIAKFENDEGFKALCAGLEKKWAKKWGETNAVDEGMDVKTKMERAEKKEDEGASNKPIIIEDGDDVQGVVEIPVTAVMKQRSNVGFRNHHGHQGVQNDIADVQRQQATQSSKDNESATLSIPKMSNHFEAKSFPRKTFMNRLNEPSVSQSLPENVPQHMGMNMVNDNNNDNGRGRAGPGGYASIEFGYSSMLNVPRQMAQPVRNYIVDAPAMRASVTDMEMVDAQYGYGRENAQATNGPYFLSRVRSNRGAHGSLINIPKHSGHPDPYYVSPYRMYPGGYGNMQNVPRNSGQSGQSGQLQHHVSLQGTNPESHGSVANIPRYSGQPQATIAPTVAASEHRGIEGAATGRSQQNFHG